MSEHNGHGTLTRMRQAAARLHNDERGAEGLEKLLIIAAIVIPLLGLLIVFRNYITEWVKGDWQDMKNKSDSFDPDLP